MKEDTVTALFAQNMEESTATSLYGLKHGGKPNDITV